MTKKVESRHLEQRPLVPIRRSGHVLLNDLGESRGLVDLALEKDNLVRILNLDSNKVAALCLAALGLATFGLLVVLAFALGLSHAG